MSAKQKRQDEEVVSDMKTFICLNTSFRIYFAYCEHPQRPVEKKQHNAEENQGKPVKYMCSAW